MGRILDRFDYAGAAFQGEFSDYLVITGAAGAGSLTAIFNVQTDGLASYSVIAGHVQQFGRSLSATTVPVTSSFTFGAPTRIGGMLMGSLSSNWLSPEDREFQLRAELRITEIRVFDAAGDLVTGALIEPQGSAEDFFEPVLMPIPEPPAWMLSAAGICVFVSGRLVRVMRRAA